MFGVTGLRASLLSNPRGFGYLSWVGWWLFGHVAAATGVGLSAAWLGREFALATSSSAGLTLVLACVLWALEELRVLQIPMPYLRRQVPRLWIAKKPWNWLAFGFGCQLGAAFLTHVTSTLTYAAFALAAMSGSLAGGAIVGGLYGAARAAIPALMGPSATDPTEALRWTLTFDSVERWVRYASAGLLLAVAAVVFLTSPAGTSR